MWSRCWSFLYQFFFIDQKTNQISTTKFFSVVGSILFAVMFPYAVVVGSKAEFDVWLVIGVVLIGNRTTAKFIHKKSGS